MMTESARVKEKNDNNKDDDEWEVVGEIINKSKEDDVDDDKGHQKRHSTRGEK